MNNYVKKLEDEMSSWPHVSVHEHRFGGHEFLFDKAEVGHVHTGGIVDIPFTLIAELRECLSVPVGCADLVGTALLSRAARKQLRHDYQLSNFTNRRESQ